MKPQTCGVQAVISCWRLLNSEGLDSYEIDYKDRFLPVDDVKTTH